MTTITEWHDRELLAEVSGRVLNGMDKACAFAADQARGLVPVRTGLLKSEIDYEVEPEGNDVIGYVGVKKGHAFYALMVERGTRKARARPYLRPAVFGHAAEIAKLIAEG